MINVITITGIGDHFQPVWLITFTGMGKLRQGSYFPPFLEPRKTAEKALVTVIQEAWIGGVWTRRVDELVQAMGRSGISKSQVSKLCKRRYGASGEDKAPSSL